jgi:hypothetical protein
MSTKSLARGPLKVGRVGVVATCVLLTEVTHAPWPTERDLGLALASAHAKGSGNAAGAATSGGGPPASGWVSAVCVNVRDGPGSKARIIGHLFKGDSLEVLAAQSLGKNSWYRVRDGAGYIEGWLSAAYVSNHRVRSDFVLPQSYKEQRTPSVDPGVTSAFVGAQACKNCHQGAHDREYAKWLTHFHSDAYQTLRKSYASAFAKKRGIESPTSDWRCLKCHVTAYGVSADRKAPGYLDSEGVTCEACHGPGGSYLDTHDRPNADKKSLEASGFRVFRNLEQRDLFCRSCHNELSPTYKPFNVELFSEAIRHWDKKTEAIYAQRLSELANQVSARTPAVVDSLSVAASRLPSGHAEPIAAEPSPGPPTRAAETALPSPSSTPIPAHTPAAEPHPTPMLTRAPEPASTSTEPASPTPSTNVPSQATAVPGGQPGPREVILNQWAGASRGPIRFTHHRHTKYVEQGNLAANCLVCHHTNKPTERMGTCGECHKRESTARAPNRELAFHNSCRSCHREQQAGPTTCSACHGS